MTATDVTPEAAYAAALVAFQKEMPHVGKGQKATVPTKSGGSYSYSFADLAAVTEALVPILTKHGLAWTAKPTTTEAGFVLRCALRHEAGYCDQGDYPLPDPGQHSPQEIGSAITYARRYALTALTGVAPSGEDDDGRHASNSRARTEVDPAKAAWDAVANAARALGWTPAKVAEDFAQWSTGQIIGEADAATLTQYRDYLDEERRRGQREHRQLVADVNDTTQAGKTRKDSPDRNRVERSDHADAGEWAAEPVST